MSSVENVRFEDLLEHQPFLRGLARQLVHEAARADDLAQHTLLAAVHQRVRDPSKIRAWLRRIANRLVHEQRRAAERRTLREERAAQPEATVDTAAIVERLELQRILVECVLALDETYRTVVLLRFYEALPPRRIASLLNVPVATVRTRVQRATEMLRREIERRYGPRERWLPALAMLAWRGSSVLLAAKLGVAVALLIAAAFVAVPLLTPRSHPATSTHEVADAPQSPPPANSAAEPRRDASAGAARSSVAPAADRLAIKGTVVDELRQPLAGATVRAFRDRADIGNAAAAVQTVTTDDSGAFAIVGLGQTRVHLVVSRDGFTSCNWRAEPGSRFESGRLSRIQLYDAHTITGVVTSEDGKPLAGARLIGFNEDRAIEFTWPEATSDEQGRFTLSGLPLSEVFIHAFAPGCEWQHAGPFDAVTNTVEIRMRRGSGATLNVVVRRARDGEPITDARVSFLVSGRRGQYTRMPRELQESMVDASGRCTFADLPPEQYEVGVYSPAIRFAPDSQIIRLDGGEHQEVEFTAGDPIMVEGRAELADHVPLAGATLCVATMPLGDPTCKVVTQEVGSFQFQTPVAENAKYVIWLADSEYALIAPNPRPWYVVPEAKRDVPLQLLAVKAASVRGRVQYADGCPASGVDVFLEKAPEEWFTYQQADEDGTFAFAGLAPQRAPIWVRSGDVRLEQPVTLAAGQSNEGLVLTRVRPSRVSGVVRDDRGDPWPGIGIAAGRGSEFDKFDTTLTARDGRFVLERVVPGVVEVRVGDVTSMVDGPKQDLTLAPGEAKDDLVFVMPRSGAGPGVVCGRRAMERWQRRPERLGTVGQRSRPRLATTRVAGRSGWTVHLCRDVRCDLRLGGERERRRRGIRTLFALRVEADRGATRLGTARGDARTHGTRIAQGPSRW